MKLLVSNRGRLFKILTIFALTLTFLSFVIDLRNTLTYGGIDLRTRVVGARVLLEGLDPYFFKWHQGLSDRLLDPTIMPKALVSAVTSRVTVPPTVLVLHSAIACLPYFSQKIIWLLFQWACLLATLGIFIRKSESSLQRNLLMTLFLFFVNSSFWHIHVERGQIYIVYMFLLSLAWLFSQASWRYHNIISGLLIGMVISLRPPYLLILIPFLIYRQWPVLWGSVAGVVSSVILSLAIAKMSIWKSYFLAMGYIANLVDLSIPTGPEGNISEIPVYPTVIEGLTSRGTAVNPFGGDSSLKQLFATDSFQTVFDWLNVGFTPSAQVLCLTFLVLVTLFSLFLMVCRQQGCSVNLIFLLGISLYLIGEFFIPTPRYAYYDIQWLLPISLILIEADVLKLLPKEVSLLLLFCLLASVGAFNWLQPLVWMPNLTLLSIYLMALYTTLMCSVLLRQEGYPIASQPDRCSIIKQARS